MFAKLFKWFGIVLGGLVVIAVIVVGILYAIGNARLTKKYEVQRESLALPNDQASVELGKKWATALCTGCHGTNLSGKPMVNDKIVGYLAAPNLTSGEGGEGREMTDEDWILALRHGVSPHDGTPLIGMPSMNYYYLSDQDLGAILAYLKTIPPVDHDMGETNLSFMGKGLLGAGIFGKDILPAEKIVHTGPRPSAVEQAASPKYGEYLVRIEGCRDCHGENLNGGQNPEPGAPHAPNITSNGVFGTWSEETFVTAVRTMKGKGMPWAILKPLGDTELDAIFQYLQSLP